MSATKPNGTSCLMTKELMTIIFLAVLSLVIPLGGSLSSAADKIEDPKSCKQCGMDRSVFDRSRMLIAYADGTTVGVCSLHCAAREIRQNKDRQIKSLMVADYMTKELIDAKTAYWVIGGRIQGVMTSLPKWAFARGEDAQKFVKENGGKISSFDETMKAAKDEVEQSGKMSH